MANQTGIAIVIKAFLPTGKTLDEQFAALSLVKAAHETGDYSSLLKAAGVEEVKTEQKTRRIEDGPSADEIEAKRKADHGRGFEAGKLGQAIAGDDLDNEAFKGGWDEGSQSAESEKNRPAEREVPEAEMKPAADADVPEFLRKDKKSKAA